MNQEHKIQAEYDEIDLMDYVIVIFKSKWLIFGVFLVAVITAIVLSSVMTKVYKIDTSLEIGVTRKQVAAGLSNLIENPIQIKEKINSDIYGILIRERLGTEGGYPKTKVGNPKNTSLIQIGIESSNIQRAKNILEEMNNLILAEHEEKIESAKKLIENNIKTIEDKIQLVESDIEKTKNKIEPIESNIERIENKIEHTKEEENNLEAKVEALEKVLVYEQTPGTQFALFDTKEKLANKKQEIESLYLQINSLEITKEDLDVKINSLKTNIEDLNAQINSFKASLDEIKPTKVIKTPTVSKNPIKPRKMLNITIAGVLGIFIGTFLALGKEWWQKLKKSYR